MIKVHAAVQTEMNRIRNKMPMKIPIYDTHAVSDDSFVKLTVNSLNAHSTQCNSDRKFRGSRITCFTETWLSAKHSDPTHMTASHMTIRQDILSKLYVQLEES